MTPQRLDPRMLIGMPMLVGGEPGKVVSAERWPDGFWLVVKDDATQTGECVYFSDEQLGPVYVLKGVV